MNKIFSGPGMPSSFLNKELENYRVAWFQYGLLGNNPFSPGLAILDYDAYLELVEKKNFLKRSWVNSRSGPILWSGCVPFFGVQHEKPPLQFRQLADKVGKAHGVAGRQMTSAFKTQLNSVFEKFEGVVRSEVVWSAWSKEPIDPAGLSLSLVNEAFRQVLMNGVFPRESIEKVSVYVGEAVQKTNAYAFVPAPISTVLPWFYFNVQRLRLEVSRILKRDLAPHFGADESLNSLVSLLYKVFVETGMPHKKAVDKTVEYIYAFVQAGLHTTIVPLSYGLCLIDEISDDLRDELLLLKQLRISEDELTIWTALQDGRFPVATRFILKILSLYPPILMDPRVANQNFSVAGESVPDGTSILISPYWVSRAYWQKYLDGEFEGVSEFSLCINHPAFLIGLPGSCLGNQLAVVELFLAFMAFASLLQEFGMTVLSELPKEFERPEQSTLGYRGGSIVLASVE